MISSILSLFSWLPDELKVIAIGAVFIFLVVILLRLVKLILDVIPFV